MPRLKTKDSNTIFKFGTYFLLVVFCFFVFFFILNVIFPFKFETSYSTIVLDKNDKIIHTFLNQEDKWRMKTELEEISPILKQTIVFKEDKYFYYHFGINPVAIGRAIGNNVFKRKRTSGASTISMQLARLIEPKPRTYKNKLLEMFRAMQLEWNFTKDEILQLYLNLVPYGGNIEGVKSAAVLYFNKNPRSLSLAEATVLSIVPNRPSSLALGKRNDKILVERNKWLKRMKKEGIFNDEMINDALTEPLLASRKNSPKHCPQFGQRIKNSHPELDIIKTSLDFEKQKVIQNLTSNYIKQQKDFHIQNAAVLLINNQTKKVEAYISSADFNNRNDGGQVDGIKAIRSPGSTLKPILYALSVDAGLISPKMIIEDVPMNFGAYAPLNYDRHNQGKVSVEDALANSLNIPAVDLLNKLGIKKMTDALTKTNFRQIEKDASKLGLSLALGGCGVSLEELTKLYAAFANHGEFYEPSFLAENDGLAERQIISESAAYLINEILLKVKRPDLPSAFAESAGLPNIAWKTGTSYGRKDAWSIGFNSLYTIGVWVGNFSGKGVPELSGASKAAPLLFEIFNQIDRGSPALWNIAPKEIDYRWVCTESGLLENHFCEHTVMEAYIPLVSPNRKCKHLKQTWTDPEENISYCRKCLPTSKELYKEKMTSNLSNRLLAFYKNQHISHDSIPPHNPDCDRVSNDFKPQITSLTDGLNYLLDPNDNDQLLLECNAAFDVEKIHWFVNNKFVNTVKANEKIFFKPDPGSVKISCADDKGRNSDIEIKVSFY